MSAGPLPTVDEVFTVDEAFAACGRITRQQAKNFAFGILLLRRPERRALSAVYAMARRIDDIGDGSAPVEERLAGLDQVQRQLSAIGSGTVDASDPVQVALAAVAARCPLPLDAFAELVEGCRLDVLGTRYEHLEDLVAYCRLVAGTVGRLTVGVLGVTDPLALRLADDLGVALQLTNILRDVTEDRAMGRVYLPAAEAVGAGVSPDLDDAPEALARLVVTIGRQADRWYERGLQVVPFLDHRGRACVAAMAGIYRRLLGRILDDPTAVCRGRVGLSTGHKAWVALQSLAGHLAGPVAPANRAAGGLGGGLAGTEPS